MKIILMTAAIAISLGATSASRASTLESPTMAIEKTDAIAQTRTTIKVVVLKNGRYCYVMGRSVVCY
jgi:hypothetical protein